MPNWGGGKKSGALVHSE
uniref:Cysteine and glycine rich protein 1 n=16 Tax=Boreoeutheria TaxID=1437010 RepID=A0A087X134_HUMAN